MVKPCPTFHNQTTGRLSHASNIMEIVKNLIFDFSKSEAQAWKTHL